MHDNFISAPAGLYQWTPRLRRTPIRSRFQMEGYSLSVAAKSFRRRFPTYPVEDADGYLLPAFIDPHSHYTNLAMAELQIPLDGLSSEAQIEAAVREYLSQNKPAPGEWLTARGWDNNNFRWRGA